MKKNSNNVEVSDAETIKKLYRVGAIGAISEKAVLHPILAAYLATRDVLPKKDYLKTAKKTDKLAEEKLEVVKHLWSRGYITRFSLEGEDYLRVHRKGFRPGEDRTQYLLKVVKKDWKPSLAELIKMLELAGQLRKELIVAYLHGGKIHFLRFGRSTFE